MIGDIDAALVIAQPNAGFGAPGAGQMTKLAVGWRHDDVRQ